MNIGKQLKKLCKGKDVTISQLSRATKIPLPTLTHSVNGRPPRKLEYIKALCDYLSVRSDELLFGTQPISTKRCEDYSDEISAGRFKLILKKIRLQDQSFGFLRDDMQVMLLLEYS